MEFAIKTDTGKYVSKDSVIKTNDRMNSYISVCSGINSAKSFKNEKSLQSFITRMREIGFCSGTYEVTRIFKIE